MLLSWADLGTSVAVNVGVTLVVLIAFNWFRRLPWLFEFYAAKRKLSIPFRCGAVICGAHGVQQLERA